MITCTKWCFRVAAHLLELLVCETVELYDELAVGGRDLSAGVDDLDDVQLLPQAHLCADLPTQVLDVLHLEGETQTCFLSCLPFAQVTLLTLKTKSGYKVFNGFFSTAGVIEANNWMD